MAPRPFLDMGVAGFGEKDKPSQQSPEVKLRESKSLVDLMECKAQQICTSKDIILDKDKLDSGRDNSSATTDRSTAEQGFPGWLSNKVPRLNSFRDVDQASETMSMIKKARVSVRARSESSMVSKLRILLHVLYLSANST